jgi:hypothetical protein
MKGLPFIIALGAVALMADGADAAQVSQHRHAQIKAEKMPHASANSYGYVQRQAAPAKPYNRLEHPYESDANGRQSYPNPDRVFTTGHFP